MLGGLQQISRDRMGDPPMLIGEFGIPYEMNGGEAFRTGDWSKQEVALDASYRAMDELLLHTTQWNYTADNSHDHGDQWNDEDLSIFSPDDVDRPGRPRLRRPGHACVLPPVRPALGRRTRVDGLRPHDRRVHRRAAPRSRDRRADGRLRPPAALPGRPRGHGLGRGDDLRPREPAPHLGRPRRRRGHTSPRITPLPAPTRSRVRGSRTTPACHGCSGQPRLPRVRCTRWSQSTTVAGIVAEHHERAADDRPGATAARVAVHDHSLARFESLDDEPAAANRQCPLAARVVRARACRGPAAGRGGSRAGPESYGAWRGSGTRRGGCPRGAAAPSCCRAGSPCRRGAPVGGSPSRGRPGREVTEEAGAAPGREQPEVVHARGARSGPRRAAPRPAPGRTARRSSR